MTHVATAPEVVVYCRNPIHHGTHAEKASCWEPAPAEEQQ